MSSRILANENYMNDAVSTFFSNINQGIKRKEDMSIWGPVEMPVKGKSDFFCPTEIYKTEINENVEEDMSIWGPIEMPVKNKSSIFYPTDIYKTEINESVNVLNKSPSTKKGKLCHNSAKDNLSEIPKHTNRVVILNSKETYKSIMKEHRNNYVENSERSGKKSVFMIKQNTDKDKEQILCHQQISQNNINYIIPESQNVENIKICDNLNVSDTRNSLRNNFSDADNNRLLSNSDLKLETDGKRCIDSTNEPLVHNMKSNYGELEADSGILKNTIKNIHENMNLVNSSKVENSYAKADTGSEWCEDGDDLSISYTRDSLRNNFSDPDNNRFVSESDLKLRTEGKKCVDSNEPSVYDMKSNYEELKADSSTLTNTINNIHENTNLVNSSKVENSYAKADVKSESCESRKTDTSESCLNQSDVLISLPSTLVTEIQNLPIPECGAVDNNEKSVDMFNKVKKFLEYLTVIKNSVCNSLSKNNKSAEETLISNNSDQQNDQQMDEIPIEINNGKISKEKQKCFESHDTHQEVPKTIDKSLNDCISGNIQQFPIDPSNEGTIQKGKNLEQKVSNISSEPFYKSELKLPQKKKTEKHRSYELPPRFKKNEKERTSLTAPKESLSNTKIHSKNISLKEDPKEKGFRKKKESNHITNSSECIFSSQKDQCFPIQRTTQLCIKISDEKDDKDFDFMADSDSISRIKKIFPKFSADIPDVDSGSKKMHYSADAMNIILRLVFCRSYKNIMPPPITGLEVLAAAQAWDINDRFGFFQEKFLQDVLPSANGGLVFPYAQHYNLKEVCDACKHIFPSEILNTTIPIRRQKICFVSISTYIEPLEICIPFKPIDTDISLSFKKEIHNKFTFTAVSGCYTIIGFQIQLNGEHVKIEKEESKNKLEIDYSVRNVNIDQEINGREEKPIRSVNVIKFKKGLVLKPSEVGEITVETVIEPYLCSALEEKNERVQNSVGELDVMMESNRKINHPEKKLFLVGKFFYHATAVPGSSRK